MNIRLRGALLWAAAAMLVCVVSTARADHRSAPTIDSYSAIGVNDSYSAIGVNDVFMFRDPSGCAPASAGRNLVMVLSTQAVADPSFGLSYHFQANALYRFNFSTTPNAISKGLRPRRSTSCFRRLTITPHVRRPTLRARLIERFFRTISSSTGSPLKDRPRRRQTRR